MTVENINPIQHFTANGSTKVFAVNFAVEGKENIRVIINNETLSANEYNYDKATNAVICNTAPQKDADVVIARLTSLDRSLNYQTYNNSFRPEALNYDLDRLWHALQESKIADAVFLARLKSEIDTRRYSDSLLQHQIDILNDVLIGVFEKASSTYLNEKLQALSNSLNQIAVDAKSKADKVIQELSHEKNNIISDLKGAIELASAVGAGKNGWTTQLVIDSSGNSQQAVNDEQRLKTQYVTIQMFTGANDHEKFLNAIASNKNILVTSGDYTINNNDINKMLTHKNGQFIHFENGVRIFFNYNGMPLFNCVNSNGGGLTGYAEFIFTGPSQITSNYNMNQYKAACNVANIVGGPHELHTVIMRVNCNHHKIADHFKFRSLSDDRNNGIIFCINDKGDGTTQTLGNTIGDCTFENSIHGLLAASQKNFRYGNFYGNKRWSHPDMPPGHVVYLTGHEVNGYLDDGFVGDIYDLGNELDLDDGFNLAPLAPKGCRNVQFGSVISYHFNGLVQTMTSCYNCTFKKMTWNYYGTLQSGAPHFNMTGINDRIVVDIEVDAPNVIFKMYEGSADPLNNSRVTLKVRCSQSPSSGNTQMIRAYGSHTTFDIEWTPSDQIVSNYVIPYEELPNIPVTNKNFVNLKLRGDNVSHQSTRTILRSQTCINIDTSTTLNRDIVWSSLDDFPKKIYRPTAHRYNKAGVSTAGTWIETFQMPAEGMFILSLSAYALGSGHSSAWLLNYTPSLGMRLANKLGEDQNTSNPRITLTSITVSTTGLVTLTFEKTTTDLSTLNVNLMKIGTLF